MDDSAVYHGEFVRAALSPKLDKNGNTFCSIQVAVLEGDFEGRTVNRNYLALPVAIHQDMSKRERIKAQDLAVSFARFCRAFGIKGKMPAANLGNAESTAEWQEWISQFYGNTGRFTVQNQEFPENSGRMRSGINDFIF
jgi:hypothetical protein